MKEGLIIFARDPLPGRVKTRLAATIGDLAAAELYGEMLREVLETSRHLDGVETVVYWDCEEASLQRLSDRYRCNSLRQCRGELGQRMEAAFSEMFAEGFASCCIIGSDTPDLPLSYIRKAFRLLAARETDVLFGPAHDGGYYLLGMRKLWPQLFTGIAWSTSETLQQSLAAAGRAGAAATLLPEWRDVDTYDDLTAYRKRALNPTNQTGPL